MERSRRVGDADSHAALAMTQTRRPLLGLPDKGPRQLVLSVLLLSALTAGRVHSQQSAQVTRETSCPNCRIIATRVAAVGDKDGPGSIGAAPWLACRKRGQQFAAVTMSRPGEVLLFDHLGRFQRSVGRAGEGPGEFRVAFPLKFGPGDSLWVFQPSARRVTVFDSTLKYVRTLTLPTSPAAAAPFANGAVVLQGSIPTRDRIGLPIHVLSSAGVLGGSFGSTTGEMRPDDPFVSARRLAPASDGRVWSARLTEYTIERWDTAGTLDLRLLVETTWFKPWRRDPSNPKATGPMIIDVQEDASGLLWVLHSVRDPSFDDGRKSKTAQSQRRSSSGTSAEYDSVLEVIDPGRRVVLASVRLEPNMRGFACEGITYAYEEDEAGYPFLEVWSFSLTAR